MDKEQKEREYFLARIRNLFELCDRQSCSQFSEFLTPEQAAYAASSIRGERLPFCFYGGYEGAERVMLGVFPDWSEPDPEEFPIVGATFRYPAAYPLSHRDFLGTLMGQQIRRETVGDILVREGETFVLADEKVEKVLFTQIDRVGKVGVRVERGIPENPAGEQKFREIRGTLASLRLDAAVSLCCGVSREKAAGLIAAGLVQKNHLPASSADIRLVDGDILTARGFGKYLLRTDGSLTRKGRIAVCFMQYL